MLALLDLVPEQALMHMDAAFLVHSEWKSLPKLLLGSAQG